MHFSLEPGKVRGEVFRESGKWYTTVELDMSDVWRCHPAGSVFRSCPDAVLEAYKASPAAGHYSGMWLVVLDPYYEQAFPVMVQLP